MTQILILLNANCEGFFIIEIDLLTILVINKIQN